MIFAEALAGGDRRSTGRADEVAGRVLADPKALPELVACLSANDAVVRMRAGDAIEKISARRADLFAPHAGVLLALSEAGAEREMRWHLAQMLPRLGLEGAARQRAVALLLAFSEDPSRIVRAFALTALAAFAEKDTALRPRVGAMIRAASSEAPAVRARARMLRRDHGWI